MNGVLAVVGARLSSSRLPGKHLLELAGKPLIARLFQRLDAVPELAHKVLATTAGDENRALVQWAESANRDVYAHRGDVNDLMGRVDAVVRDLNPAIIIYICGDSPLIEPGFISRLIQALRSVPGADMVRVDQETAPVIHEGVDIFSRACWDRTLAASQSKYEREHVGLARRKIQDQLTAVTLREPPIFSRIQHRLSVDTPSDYRFMETIYRRWYAANPAVTQVSLEWVIRRLLADPELRAINAGVRQRRAEERPPRIALICAAGPQVGLGHLSRTLIAARALEDGLGAGIRVVVIGPPRQHGELKLLEHRFTDEPLTVLKEELARRPDAIIFDHPRDLIDRHWQAALEQARAHKITLISIDFALPRWAAHLNWVPSHFLAADLRRDGRIRYGWDCFLLDRIPRVPAWRPGRRVLILTGSTDAHGLGQTLPAALARHLPRKTEIHWVRGPHAPAPKPVSSSAKWFVHEDPYDINVLMQAVDYAIAVHGLSLFECLSLGLPTVTLAPDRPEDDPEMTDLGASGTTARALNVEHAAELLAELMADEDRARVLATTALAALDGQGGQRLAEAVGALISPDQKVS
jgi:spore coat polysaccharide biosynthesis protein SpsF (cytidylyltransferase family)/spore coat polysaccharide biosynthesis predicted glycosyltransferase SpsG